MKLGGKALPHSTASKQLRSSERDCEEEGGGEGEEEREEEQQLRSSEQAPPLRPSRASPSPGRTASLLRTRGGGRGDEEMDEEADKRVAGTGRPRETGTKRTLIELKNLRESFEIPWQAWQGGARRASSEQTFNRNCRKVYKSHGKPGRRRLTVPGEEEEWLRRGRVREGS